MTVAAPSDAATADQAVSPDPPTGWKLSHRLPPFALGQRSRAARRCDPTQGRLALPGSVAANPGPGRTLFIAATLTTSFVAARNHFHGCPLPEMQKSRQAEWLTGIYFSTTAAAVHNLFWIKDMGRLLCQRESSG